MNSTSPADEVASLSRSDQWHAVTASFLGWTLDAFDFFVLVFLVDTLAKAFTVNVRAGRLADSAPMEPLKPAPWPTREQAPDTPKSDQPEGQAI